MDDYTPTEQDERDDRLEAYGESLADDLLGRAAGIRRSLDEPTQWGEDVPAAPADIFSASVHQRATLLPELARRATPSTAWEENHLR